MKFLLDHFFRRASLSLKKWTSKIFHPFHDDGSDDEFNHPYIIF